MNPLHKKSLYLVTLGDDAGRGVIRRAHPTPYT